MGLDIYSSSMKPDNLTVERLWWRISRFLASKGHQKPGYRLRSIDEFYTSVRDDSRYLCHFRDVKWKEMLIYTLCLKEPVCKLSAVQHECFVEQFLLIWYPGWKLNVLLVWPVSFCRVMKKHLISTLKMLQGKLPWKLIIRNSKYDHRGKTRNDLMYWFNFNGLNSSQYTLEICLLTCDLRNKVMGQRLIWMKLSLPHPS